LTALSPGNVNTKQGENMKQTKPSWDSAVEAVWTIKAMSKALYYLSAYTLSEDEIVITTDKEKVRNKEGFMIPRLASTIFDAVFEIHEFLNEIEPLLDMAIVAKEKGEHEQ
jgi:hypothetical protein